MADIKSLVPTEGIEKKIYFIRGQKVILDTDLAELFGVETKRLNEQVKRNLYGRVLRKSFYTGYSKTHRCKACAIMRNEAYFAVRPV